MHNEDVLKKRVVIGEHLKSIRREKQLSYYAVAKISGLSISQVKSIELGDKSYTIDSLLKIANSLGVNLVMNQV